MDTDEQPLILHQHLWSLQLKTGQKIPLPPRGEKGVQPLWVTDVFLVGPENAATQGAVAACVQTTSTGNSRVLALLSTERPCVELGNPVVLDDEELCFYLISDADVGEVVVQIEGFMFPLLPSLDTNEELEEEEEGEEDAASSEDDDDTTSDKDYEEEDDESDDEDECDHVRPVAARTFLGLFLFTYMIAFFKLIM
jgi:hypothetical protein